MRRHGEEADPEVIGDQAALEESAAPDRDEPEVDLAAAAPEPAASTGEPVRPAAPARAPAADLADDRLDSGRTDGRE